MLMSNNNNNNNFKREEITLNEVKQKEDGEEDRP